MQHSSSCIPIVRQQRCNGAIKRWSSFQPWASIKTIKNDSSVFVVDVPCYFDPFWWLTLRSACLSEVNWSKNYVQLHNVNTFSFIASIGIQTNTGDCSAQQFITSNHLHHLLQQSETVCHIRAWYTLLQVRKVLVHTLRLTKSWPPTRSGSVASWQKSGICLRYESRLPCGQALVCGGLPQGRAVVECVP